MDDFRTEFSNYRTLLVLDKIQSTVERTLISVGLILVSFILAINIVINAVFDTSFYWVTESSQYIIVWVIFIGSSTLIRETEHVNLDIILKFLSKKMELFLEIFIYIVVIIFVSYLIYIGLIMTLKIFSEGQTGTVLKISMGWVYLSFPVGMTLMTINSIKILALKIKKVRDTREWDNND